MKQWLLRIVGCIALLYVSAALRGDDVFVPWKVLNPGDAPADTSLVLFWVPGSRDELRHSELLVSRPLAMYATQCVGMHVVRPDDDARIAKLDAAGKLPLCVLAQHDGTAIAHVGGDHSALRAADVEKMVRDELDSRDAAADRLLDDARRKVDAGDRDAAIGLYRQVAAQSCLFPRKAHDAQKALKKLGAEK